MDKKEFLESEKLNFANQMDPEMIAQNQDVIKPSKLTEEVVEAVNPETGEIMKVIPIAEKENPNPVADLLQKYTDLDLDISKLIIAQDAFMKENKELFDKLDSFNQDITKIREEQAKVTEELKQAMRENNCKEEVGIRFIAKYTAPYTKKKFNTKQFYEDYAEDTAMYKKYVETTHVSDSIKISEVKSK